MSDNDLFDTIGKNVSYYRRLYSLEKEKMTQEKLAEKWEFQLLLSVA